MTFINLPNDQKRAISAVEDNALQDAIRKCLEEECVAPIRELRLFQCGPYVSSKLQDFEKQIIAYGNAKSYAKREEVRVGAVRAGSNLVYAVEQMKSRVETENEEGQLFWVDDQIMPPFHFGSRLTVRILFRWRQSSTEEWRHGHINYVYDYTPPFDYSQMQLKRKPSKAKSARDLQDRLYEEWARLKMQALQSVREFLRNGGDGAAIPQDATAKPSQYGGGLNNYSCNFWQ